MDTVKLTRKFPATLWHNLAFGLGVVLMIGMGVQGLRIQKALLDANARVNSGLELITVIQELLTSTQAIETGERGYVITGQANYLTPYHQARTRLADERARLGMLLDDRPEINSGWLASLDRLIERRQAIASANIAVRESDGLEAASLRVLAAGGRQTTDQLRDLLEEFMSTERERLAADIQRAEQQAERAQWLDILGALLIAVLFVAAFISINRNLHLRHSLMRDAEHREARLAALLQAVPDELYRIDPPYSVTRLDVEATPPSVSEAFGQELLARLAATEDRTVLHTFLWHDGGSEFEVRILPTSDGEYLAISRDVTDRLRSRRRLRDQQAFLRSVVDADENLIFARDIQGRFLLCNQAFAHFLGMEPEQLEGLRPAELTRGNLLLPLLAGDSGLLAGRAELRVPEVEVQDVTGQVRGLQLLKRTLTLSDSSRYLLAVAVDITERRQMERMKAEFIATVSHELRTPLTAIRGALDVLSSGMEGQLPEPSQPLVEIAHKNSERLVRLINDILDIEKLESGHLTFHTRLLALQPLVRQALLDNAPYAEEFGISLHLDGELADGIVEIDPDRFAQVMSNLLSNACKHSPRGGRVSVGIRRTSRAEADTASPWLEIRLTDRGHGIPETFQSKVFDRFAQADSSDRRRTGGTGLGLAITRSLVVEQGGEIGFTSTPGKGTCFQVRLPCVADIASPSAEEGS
ncbi:MULTISPECIES: ATP-binding protein [Halomonadaceae]|uniref:sensor histidine kinase n=1 Tax=Halomonadaceae TaxID=28256 RepID=UPI0015978A95|nr:MULTISPECIES: ATP-binding protein [Halomonas]QJQ94218.1 PAS domain S-box protein [Halomonas sp. PA5]